MSTHFSVSERIQSIINETPVVLFIKGTADMPSCGFSNFVVQIFKGLNVDFKTIDVLSDQEIRQGIKDFTDWPTIPQIYINGEFKGGADIMRDLYQSGELVALLEMENIPFDTPTSNTTTQ